MEDIINNDERQTQVIELTPTVKNDLTSSAKWSKVFGVLSFIGAGICLIAAVGSLFLKSAMTSMADELDGMDLSYSAAAFSGIMMFVIYLICAVIGAVLGYLLFSTGKKILNGVSSDNQEQTAAGLHHLKIFCQIYGIITIIALAFACLTIIGSIFIGIFAATL